MLGVFCLPKAFFFIFFHYFSSPMYSTKPNPGIFFDLPILILWKCPKNGRGLKIRPKIGYPSSFPEGTSSVIFSFTLFSSQMYSQGPYSERFSVYHFSFVESVQKMSNEVIWGQIFDFCLKFVNDDSSEPESWKLDYLWNSIEWEHCRCQISSEVIWGQMASFLRKSII